MRVYQFDTEIAQLYGVDNAIMIWNFTHWIEHNAANGMHFHDGRYWTYNTVDALTKIFPFWSKGQIRRILKSLEEQNVIITGNYNSSAYLRTMWYAFTDSFQQMHLSKSTNGKVETEESNNSLNNNDTNKHIINTDDKPADGGLFPMDSGFVPVTVTRPRRTSEPDCLFADSKFSDYNAFAAHFTEPEFNLVDIVYYYHAIWDWSSSGGKKQKDWIATARKFIRRDMAEKRVHSIQQKTDGLTPEAKEYLESLK